MVRKIVLSLELIVFAFVKLDIGVINVISLVVLLILVKIQPIANLF